MSELANEAARAGFRSFPRLLCIAAKAVGRRSDEIDAWILSRERVKV